MPPSSEAVAAGVEAAAVPSPTPTEVEAPFRCSLPTEGRFPSTEQCGERLMHDVDDRAEAHRNSGALELKLLRCYTHLLGETAWS